VAPFGSFTAEDVEQLRFSSTGGKGGGAAWVWMYVALLVTVVIVPRLLLATWSAWHENRLERRVPLDLQDNYYQRVLSLLQSTRVQLALVATREEDRSRLLRVLTQSAQALPILVTTEFGDVLRLVEVAAQQPPAPLPASPAAAQWLRRWRTRVGLGGSELPAPVDAPLVRIKEDSDLILYAQGEDEREGALLHWLDKPVLEIDMGRGRGIAGRGLAFDSFGKHWAEEATLLDAIAPHLAAEKQAGFARIRRAWEDRNDERLKLSMTAVADHLLFAARQVEEVRSGALTVKHLLPSERQAQASARQAAMDAIVVRLDESAANMTSRLYQLHGLDRASGLAMEHSLEERFSVQQPVDASQAGVAGAATGAAMGASVDLLAGGLTLGAAAALGAVLGGGAAYIAAAWKNRATPTGATVVQLSDDMLEALLDAALLRYVAIVHWAGGRVDIDEAWKARVATVVAEYRPSLPGFWTHARGESEPGPMPRAMLKTLVDNMTRKVLHQL